MNPNDFVLGATMGLKHALTFYYILLAVAGICVLLVTFATVMTLRSLSRFLDAKAVSIERET